MHAARLSFPFGALLDKEVLEGGVLLASRSPVIHTCCTAPIQGHSPVVHRHFLGTWRHGWVSAGTATAMKRCHGVITRRGCSMCTSIRWHDWHVIRAPHTSLATRGTDTSADQHNTQNHIHMPGVGAGAVPPHSTQHVAPDPLSGAGHWVSLLQQLWALLSDPQGLLNLRGAPLHTCCVNLDVPGPTQASDST